MQPTPGLVLEYTPCPGGARLVRLYGDTPCPVLPESVGGLPLAELGAYCFAEPQRPAALPPPSALRRAVTGGAPGAAQHRICGGFLQQLTLPDSLRVLGDCALYNCRSLQQLCLGAGVQSLGSDVLLNTFALHTLVLRAHPAQATGLPRLLAAVSAGLRVLFCPGDAVLAAAHYPEYWEDIEETPAHILLHAYSGQGYHYRQCFGDGVPLWQEYDAVFPQARAEDPPAAMALLALDRLRWPYALAPAAARQYRQFLAGQAAAVLAALQARDDTAALAALLALDVLDAPALAAGAAAAAKADKPAFAARLTDALHQKQPAAPAARPRYDMDF